MLQRLDFNESSIEKQGTYAERCGTSYKWAPPNKEVHGSSRPCHKHCFRNFKHIVVFLVDWSSISSTHVTMTAACPPAGGRHFGQAPEVPGLGCGCLCEPCLIVAVSITINLDITACTSMYIYIHKYIYAYLYIYIYVYIHAMQICIYAYRDAQ